MPRVQEDTELEAQAGTWKISDEHFLLPGRTFSDIAERVETNFTTKRLRLLHSSVVLILLCWPKLERSALAL